MREDENLLSVTPMSPYVIPAQAGIHTLFVIPAQAGIQIIISSQVIVSNEIMKQPRQAKRYKTSSNLNLKLIVCV
jgi:hypothetical protein